MRIARFVAAPLILPVASIGLMCLVALYNWGSEPLMWEHEEPFLHAAFARGIASGFVALVALEFSIQRIARLDNLSAWRKFLWRIALVLGAIATASLPTSLFFPMHEIPSSSFGIAGLSFGYTLARIFYIFGLSLARVLLFGFNFTHKRLTQPTPPANTHAQS